MSGEDFIRKVICGVFHAKYVVVGTDFHFGYGQGGDANMLEACAATYGYEAVVLEKERYRGRIIFPVFPIIPLAVLNWPTVYLKESEKVSPC